MFTRDQIEEIKKKLIMLGTKDTQFPDAHKLNGEEIIAIVQDGENKKIPLSSIINDDFINVSKDTTEILTLSTAVSKIDINNRKLGQVITFKDSANSWTIRQFTGSSLDNWNDVSLWKSISGIDELKSKVETNTSNISSLNTEVSTLQSMVEEGAQSSDVLVSDSESSDSYDFAIADDKGNVILRLQDGGIFTKNFSSDGSTPSNPVISGVPEAPMDGKTYGRNNGAWNVITSKGESYLGSIEYTGQKIVFPKMHYKQLGTLPNNQQCCVIHNNLAIFVNGTKYWVADKNNGFNVLKAGDVGVTGVHSNVGSLGTEFYNGNTIPLIYLTDWDGEKGVKVFNLSNTTYTMSHVQSINPSSELLNSDIFGRGNTDFIVDRENGFLYSICYKEDTWREIESNKTCICKFALPRLSSGSNVTLRLADIIDHFEVENIPTRQDCCIYNGILYIENGYVNPHYKATLRAIDLSKKEVVSKIDISKIVDGEPECLEFDEDHLLMAYGKTIYGLYF